MHMRETRPRVPKQSARETQQAGRNTERETGFRDRDARLHLVALGGALIIGVLRKTSREPDGFADEEGDLHEAAGGVAEAVVGVVDLGDTLGHDEDETEAKGGPEHEEEDNGFCEEEMGGAGDGVVQEG